MNTELFIARKVFSQKEGKKGIASKIVTIAVASISVGLAVMIIAIAVLLGFKKEIREKVIGFGSHFMIVNYDSNSSFETKPIAIDSGLIAQFGSIKHITHLQQFATKPGIIKTDTEIHGMTLKGVCHNFDWKFLKSNLVSGKIPLIKNDTISNEVIISETISKLLKLSVGDKLYCYFYNEGESSPRSRRFTISGIYKTSMQEFDQLFVLGDMRHVQQLNGWSTNEITGYELNIENYKYLEEVYINLQNTTLNNASEKSMLKVYSIETKYQMLFDWLSVLDMNVWVLLFLMVAVAGINMISGLLIIIIERTRMIGILKALGYPNIRVRKVFIYLAGFLSLRGLLWGNIIGLGLCAFQYFTGLLTLDPESYYIDKVPIVFSATYLIILNIGTLLTIIGMIILPSMFISKISPVETISFE